MRVQRRNFWKEESIRISCLSVYDGNTLGKELGALLNGTEKILIPRASLGNKELAEELKNSAEICKNHAKFFSGINHCLAEVLAQKSRSWIRDKSGI